MWLEIYGKTNNVTNYDIFTFITERILWLNTYMYVHISTCIDVSHKWVTCHIYLDRAANIYIETRCHQRMWTPRKLNLFESMQLKERWTNESMNKWIWEWEQLDQLYIIFSRTVANVFSLTWFMQYGLFLIMVAK